MKRKQMLTLLKTMSGEKDKDILSVYLDLAGDKILEKRYPYNPEKRKVPEAYHSLQVDIAVYLLNKRGAEGQTVHKENGVDRTYESASVPPSMLKYVLPVAKVFSASGSDETKEDKDEVS